MLSVNVLTGLAENLLVVHLLDRELGREVHLLQFASQLHVHMLQVVHQLILVVLDFTHSRTCDLTELFVSLLLKACGQIKAIGRHARCLPFCNQE